MNMRGRIIKSFTRFPKEGWDIAFTGTTSQFRAYKTFVMKTFPNRGIGTYIHSYDLLSMIKNTKTLWEKYERIYIAAEEHLKDAIEKIFSFLGRTDGVIVQNILYPEALNRRFIYKLYSRKIFALVMSMCIRLCA